MQEDRPSSDRDQEQPAAVPAGWASDSAAAPSSSVQTTIEEMTTQMRSVVDAAERAAEAIRLDAEDQARRHLAEAQRKADRLTADRVALISELTDDLIRQATNVREHSEQMVRALEDAIGSFADRLEQPAAPRSSKPSVEITPGPTTPRHPPVSAERDQPREDVPPARPAMPAPSPIGIRVPAAADRGPENGGGAYTEIIGAPPPPPPATAPAPAPKRHDLPRPMGALQPTEEVAEATAASGTHADEPGGGEGDPEVPLDVILYATRRAANGVAPEVISSELNLRYGIEDPAPIIDRVMGRGDHPK